MLKKQQNIMLSGALFSHQNGSVERTMKMVITIPSTILMYTVMIFPKNKFALFLANGNIIYCMYIQSDP